MLSLTRLSAIFPPRLNRLIKPLAMPILKRRARKFYSEYLREGDLVFDIGAHTGDFTEIFLSLGARVVCVEPNPDCAATLRRKFRGSDVAVVEKGAGRAPGKLPFFISDESPSLSTFSRAWTKGRFSGTNWNRKMTVELTTLDSLISEFGRPAYCKIDVEGFELEVLEGLSSAIPLVSFEFTGEFIGSARKCASRLLALGYSQFSYSLYSEFRLFRGWGSWPDVSGDLLGHDEKLLCGDIFARL